ncbi:MAG: SMC-Scp complex subunit ScpB, partial [Malacoplasma sp.]
MNYKSLIEGALFIAGKDGLELDKLKKITSLNMDDLNSVIEEMTVEYEKNASRGILLKRFNNIV